jgi:hypothetical protein
MEVFACGCIKLHVFGVIIQFLTFEFGVLLLIGSKWSQNEDLNLQYFIDLQGLRGESQDLRNLTEINVFIDEICAVFWPRFDKNG